MSFFVSEHFNLSDFQTGIKTDITGNGSVVLDDGWGVVGTYRDTDAAIIFPNKGLTKAEFATTPFSVTIKWKLSSLPDGDYLRHFVLTSMSTGPETGTFGDCIILCSINRSGATYYESWRVVDSTGTTQYYDSSGGSWVTGAANVRTISVDTEYILRINYDPGRRAVNLTNGIQTSGFSSRMRYYDDDLWWFIGQEDDTSRYGVIGYDYIVVKKNEVSSRFISENHLLTEKWHSKHYSGAALWILNDFTTEVSDTIVIKNDILDYDPVESDLVLLNRIGGAGSRIYTPSVKVLLNDVDVTSQMLSYSIDWAERFFKNLTIDFDRSVSADIFRKNNADFRTPQIEILVDHGSSGTYVTRGLFFIESITEAISNGKHARRISGRSRAALLDRPYSVQNTVSYENTSKRAIVCRMVEDAGLTCTWSLPDGPIEYHTFDARTPIEVIEKIVNAIGGRISVDNIDHLYFYANDFAPESQSPVLSVDSSDIHQVLITEEIPQSFNKITVSGRANDEVTFRAWAEVELISVDVRGNIKSRIAADGDDYAVLVATCYDSEGALVDTELIEEESVTPTDANTIIVSKRITADGVVGVWHDTGGGVPGTKIDGPYTFDGSMITTTGNMLDGPHLVTYYGGDIVSLSVEGPGVVEETSVIIEDGQARTKLYGNELDAGTITVAATYDGQESNPVVLTLGDPRVGDIDANANPSSLQTGETSVITALVYDPDGDPVGDGYRVDFRLIAGNGSLSASSSATTTETIENEEQVSNSYASIRVENPISSLASIYALKGDTQEYLGITIDTDEVDESHNYAVGAVTDGPTITLSTKLPKTQTRVAITYESGGAAQVIYTAPSNVSTNGEEVVVEALAGGMNHLVFINVGRRTSDSTSVNGGKRTGSVTFTVNYTPTSSDRNGTFTLSEPIYQVPGFQEVLGFYILDELTRGIEGGSVTRIQRIGDNVVATIKADEKESISDYYSGDYVTGNRTVYIKDTEIPVVNATVMILWNGGDDGSDTGGHTEIARTNSLGIFTFREGVSGTHGLTINHDDVLNPDAPRGLHELSSTIYVAGNVGNEKIRAIAIQEFYMQVKGEFTVPIIYEAI